MKENEDVYRSLKRFNFAMGFFHLIQGIIMLILSNDFTLPIKYTTPVFDTATQTINPVSQTWFDIRIGPLVALFLFISATAHFLLSTVLYKWYVEKLKNHINRCKHSNYYNH